jgi:hypothetical protein
MILDAMESPADLASLEAAARAWSEFRSAVVAGLCMGKRLE